MEYLVYQITNNVNQKKYIGKTKNLKARLWQHKSQTVCRYLHRAILKYGFHNFSVDILKDKLTFDEASFWEGEYIKSVDTMSPNGYNLILDTHHGRSPCKETRKMMSRVQQKAQMSKRKTKSGFTGVKVTYCGFFCRVSFEGNLYCKHYKTAEEAAETYDKLQLFLRDGDCCLNFPEKREEYLKQDLEALFKEVSNKKTSSKYKGVSWHKCCQKWRAYKNENGKTIFLGMFDNEEDAYELAKQYYK